MHPPCLDCKDREIYCHSKCNKYKKYEQSRNKIRKSKEDFDYSNYLYDAIGRMKKIRVAK